MEQLSGIHIRPADINDKDFISSLVPRLIAFGPPSWREGMQMTEVDTAILIGKVTSQPEGTAIFIAHDDDNVQLGFVHVHDGKDFYNHDKHGHISDLIVAAEGQGKGIGRLLLNKAEEWARSQGYRWLTLSVFAQNVRAREIYERAGYGPDIMKYVKELP